MSGLPPTKAQQLRALVLENTHLPEAEIAALAGISEDDVWRILDAVEAPPRREVIPQQERRVVMPRSSLRSGVKYKVQPNSDADRRFGKGAGSRPPSPDNSAQRHFPHITPEQSKAKHGTASGYKALHTRFGLEPCDECKEAVRKLSAEKRHQKREHFETHEQALRACSSIMTPYFCEEHECWHIVSKSVQSFYLTDSQVTA